MPDRQMLLDLGGAPSLTREDLIVTDANRDSVALVDRWPGWASPFAVITGGAGSGKTHLATVWRSMSGAHTLADPLRPSNADLDAAQTGTPILCDGLAPDRLDEAAFFHLLNAVRGASGSILITAQTAPAGWSLATPDLSSRFRSATVAALGLPDDDLLRAVAVKLFADRQVAVDPAVVAYLLPRLERSLSALADIVERLDALALARKMSITRPLAAELLRELGNRDQPGLGL